MSAAALEATELTVRYGGRVALDGLTVSIPAGTSVAVLGPNGAGKTTLFRAAAGLAQLESGSIVTTGRRIAFVPQRLQLDPRFPVSVADVVRMGRYGELGWLRRFGEADHRAVDDAIAELRIGHLADRRFGELSGGERQRALLAQAAAQDAELMLLDEPFAGLDRPTAEELRELIGRRRDSGSTVIVATHDLESAGRDYDLVLCLNKRAVAFGPPAQTLGEAVLTETFSGHVVRFGPMLVDTAHHHHGAG